MTELDGISTDGVSPALIDMLDRGTNTECIAAADLIADMPTNGVFAVSALVRVLSSHRSQEAKINAAWAILTVPVCHDDKIIARHFLNISLLSNPTFQFAFFEFLWEKANSSKCFHKFLALSTIAEAGPRLAQFFDLLLQILRRDENAFMRGMAALALAGIRMDSSFVRRALLEAFVNDSSYEARSCIVIAVSQLWPNTEDGIDALTAGALSDPHYIVRAVGLLALHKSRRDFVSRLDPRTHVPYVFSNIHIVINSLCRALHDSEEVVRIISAHLLASIGQSACQTLPGFVGDIRPTDDSLSDALYRLIESLRPPLFDDRISVDTPHVLESFFEMTHFDVEDAINMITGALTGQNVAHAMLALGTIASVGPAIAAFTRGVYESLRHHDQLVRTTASTVFPFLIGFSDAQSRLLGWALPRMNRSSADIHEIWRYLVGNREFLNEIIGGAARIVRRYCDKNTVMEELENLAVVVLYEELTKDPMLGTTPDNFLDLWRRLTKKLASYVRNRQNREDRRRRKFARPDDDFLDQVAADASNVPTGLDLEESKRVMNDAMNIVREHFGELGIRVLCGRAFENRTIKDLAVTTNRSANQIQWMWHRIRQILRGRLDL